MIQRPWRIPDLIDLEYFLRRDEEAEADDASLRARDREIYLDRIRPELPEPDAAEPDRRGILRAWLEERRRRRPEGRETPLPGETVSEVYRLLAIICLIFGGMSGAGLAFSLLTYTGFAPLNISVYLGVLLFPQVLLVVKLILLGLFRMIRRRPFPSNSILLNLVGGLLARMTASARNRALRKLSGERREALRSVAGLLRGKRRIYGGLFLWAPFRLLQLFGVGFNLGALIATTLRVIGSDVAFGWQSTVKYSPEAAYEAVRIIALPWSWLVPPELAHPGLAEIEGSRIILKDGIFHLATNDLVSWWPFLLFAVFTYGLLPRILLWIAGAVAERRGIARLAFDHAEADRLFERMRTPGFATGGRPSAPRPPDEVPRASIPQDIPETGGARGRIALIPDEIYEACAGEELERVVDAALGYPVAGRVRVELDPEADGGRISEVARRLASGNGSVGILVVQEAWQPPIREHLVFFRTLREAVGERVRIDLGLIGRPGAGTVFTAVAPMDREVWRKKMSTLGDPYLRVERLMPDAHESNT
jgi:hypothetical protein